MPPARPAAMAAASPAAPAAVDPAPAPAAPTPPALPLAPPTAPLTAPAAAPRAPGPAADGSLPANGSFGLVAPAPSEPWNRGLLQLPAESTSGGAPFIRPMEFAISWDRFGG